MLSDSHEYSRFQLLFHGPLEFQDHRPVSLQGRAVGAQHSTKHYTCTDREQNRSKDLQKATQESCSTSQGHQTTFVCTFKYVVTGHTSKLRY